MTDSDIQCGRLLAEFGSKFYVKMVAILAMNMPYKFPDHVKEEVDLTELRHNDLQNLCDISIGKSSSWIGFVACHLQQN